MHKNILIKTNLLVCAVIFTGFVIISVIDYYINRSAHIHNVETISNLTSESICDQLEAFSAKPLNVSLTMATSPLLKNYLLDEPYEEDENYTKTIQTYLNAFKESDQYDWIFLVSAKTHRYYSFTGIDKTLTVEDPENDWYYSFIASGEDYSLNVDSNETVQNQIMVFINCRITGDDGTTLGVVGVGLSFESMQKHLQEYAKDLDVEIYMIDEKGNVQIATDDMGWPAANFFDICAYPQFRDEILQNDETGDTLTFWLTEHGRGNYVAAKYIPDLHWHLIVEHNTTSLSRQMNYQFLSMTVIIILVSMIVILIITFVLNRYNKRIIELRAEIEQEKQAAFRNATEQIYDNIYEVNLTKNRATGNGAAQYFRRLGLDENIPYDEALCIIAQKQIKKEYREGYIAMLSPENALQEYQNGNVNLTYDLLSDYDGSEYHWIRIMAHIYFWKEDDSVHMFTYHKNIDAEKRKEARLTEQAQVDGLTQVYNKAATEHYIKQMLYTAEEEYFGFIILDIDNFKQINDTCGHAFGDLVLSEFASILKSHFRKGDVVGRIGGDEFAAFLPAHDITRIREKAEELRAALDMEFTFGSLTCKTSVSIGVAIASKQDADPETLYQNADEALYQTKKQGKNGFTVYGE